MSRSISYPLPVLGNSDDYQADAGLSVDYTYEATLDSIGIFFNSFECSVAELHAGLQDGRLALFLQLDSPAAFNQLLIKIDNPFSSQLIALEVGELIYRTKVQWFVGALDNFELNTDLVSDLYPSRSFVASDYDLLAKTAPDSIYIDYEFDPYITNQRSLFQIALNPERQEQDLVVNWSSDLIQVLLPAETYSVYNRLRGSDAPIIHSSIIYPVLVQAVHYIFGNCIDDATYEDYLWFMRLQEMVRAQRLDGLEPLDVASRLLRRPFSRALICLDTIHGQSSWE